MNAVLAAWVLILLAFTLLACGWLLLEHLDHVFDRFDEWQDELP